jgi:hypothetical protein
MNKRFYRFFKFNDHLEGGEKFRFLYDKELDPAVAMETVESEMKKLIPESKVPLIKVSQCEFPARTVHINRVNYSDKYVRAIAPRCNYEIIAVEHLRNAN